jgi:hypothetical protein
MTKETHSTARVLPALLTRRPLFAYPVPMIVVFAYEMTMIASGLRQMRHRRLSKDELSGHGVSSWPHRYCPREEETSDANTTTELR